MSVNLCNITGTVLRPDGTPFANGEITFNSIIVQTVQGVLVPITNAIATTDINGNINGGAGVNLIQGLTLAVALSLNGNFNSQFTAIVPSVTTSTFGNFAQGILQTASSITQNAGLWTPTALGSTTNPTLTGLSANGEYIQIGNITYIAGRIGWTAASSAGSGNAEVGALPVTAATGSGITAFIPLNVDNGVLGSYLNWYGYLNTGSTVLGIGQYGSGSGGGFVNSPCANIWVNQPSNLHFSGVYRTT